MITLEQLLESRDNRAALQREYLQRHPLSTLVCFTVQVPGNVKRNALSQSIARAGMEVLEPLFGPCACKRDLDTGYEAYFLVPAAAQEVKKRCCALEQEHPLGRLMDIDVLGPDGLVSREDVGFAPRRCLLCGNEARMCMRARSHSVQELLDKMEQMVKTYAVQKTD